MASFKFVMMYAKKECCSIGAGIIFLLFACVNDLMMPLFVGRVVELLSEEKYA